MQKFEVERVPLTGVNLIEASAGTGKTYSVAILVLRLLIEKNIPIHRILMVTFTKAAVAEMAHRIRKFIRLAIQAAQGLDVSENLIKAYIQQKLTVDAISKEDLIKKLNDALIGLDEASIQTIHSFCQDSLQLFAFETGQAYGLKLQEDLSEIVSLQVEDFWRNQVTGLSVNFLAEMQGKKINIKTLLEAVRESLGGKVFDFTPENEDIEEVFLLRKEELYQHFESNRAWYLEQVPSLKVSRFTDAKKAELISVLQGDVKGLVKWLDGPAQYKQSISEQLFSELYAIYIAVLQAAQQGLKTLIYQCIQTVQSQIQSYLDKHHLLTYDDMIQKLHHAVTQKPDLRAKLSARFDAVFIDEFQDTDRLQYEIYDGLYGKDKILFYIGDPKQSIYAWRKADLNTYFKASHKEGVNRYTMEHNFRSTPELLDALNHFFAVENPFLSNEMNYVPVSSGLGKNPKGARVGLEPLEPIQIYHTPTKELISDRVIRLIASLLSGETQINERAIQLSDIAILVRTKREGSKLKKLLTGKGIPAITVDETKIFETEEAEYLQYLMETILEISWRGVNKAILNPFTGWKAEEILEKDPDKLVSRFKHYQQLWSERGFYMMMRQYMLDFGVLDHLQHPRNRMGKRILSNLNQLSEILQELEYRQELKPSGLLTFLQKQRIGESNEENSYLQRLEDDQEAITITTIHKAKGLEYPVVIAPYLNLKPNLIFPFVSFRDEQGAYKFDANKLDIPDTTRSLYIRQSNEENRRIVYVALTRAIYQCFIFNALNSNDDSLSPFIAVHEGKVAVHEDQAFPFPKVPTDFSVEPNAANLNSIVTPQLSLPDANWKKLSFSYLTRKGIPSPKLSAHEPADAYEEFIFKKLPKGASVGDLLHYIFERVDFQDQSSWTDIIKKSVNRYFPQFDEAMSNHLVELVQRVANVQIPGIGSDFSLSKIPLTHKVSEWEFDMSASQFSPADLMKIPLKSGFQVRSVEGQSLQGILNGLVDLIFEYEGKYYILDWKSNYLGDSWEDYREESLVESMNENNYHLQYLLYTLAFKQFMEQYQADFDFDRDFGGVVYIFFRGIRLGHDTGIFSYKPKLDQMEFLEQLIVENLTR